MDKDTKSLPYAHFDAETFQQSNERVMNFTQKIYGFFEVMDYDNAREYSGKILHTIQDFYSHSNWIELGYQGINSDIGTNAFLERYEFASKSDSTCSENCTSVELDCSRILAGLVELGSIIGFEPSPIQCELFKSFF